MPVTETVRTSWFTKLKNSVVGMFVGLVLVIAAVVVLFWNEGRAIGTYRSLVEGAGLVIDVDAGKADPANEGKLIHVAGTVVPGSVAEDTAFGIVADGALAIERRVEMYQWVEKSESRSEDKVGGSTETVTTYTYQKEWRDRPVSSSSFREAGHDNPPFPVEASRYVVDEATVGAFRIEGRRLAPLGQEKIIPLDAGDVARIGDQIATTKPVKADQGGLYLGHSASAPQVGDTRIRFERTDLAEASVVARQAGEQLEPYTTSNGRTIFLADAGTVTAAALFETAQTENTVITWIVRAGGLLALFIGFSMMMSIIGGIGSLLPPLGSILGFGTGLVALVLTLIVGPITIAIGWFAYRPLLSVGLIAGGLIIAFLIVRLRKRSMPAAETPAFGR